MPTPTGNPAWIRTNDHSAYGGNVNKTNYESVGTVNPRTDLSAENLCRIAADLAAVARTAPFAVIKFTCNDSSPAVPTINEFTAMVGGQPTGARNGNGDVTFTWSSSYNDPYGVSGTTTIIGGEATVNNIGGYFAVVIASGNSARVVVFDHTGAAVSNPTVTLVVY